MLRPQPLGLQRCGQLCRQVKDYCIEASSISTTVAPEDIKKTQEGVGQLISRLSDAVSSFEEEITAKQRQIEEAEGSQKEEWQRQLAEKFEGDVGYQAVLEKGRGWLSSMKELKQDLDEAADEVRNDDHSNEVIPEPPARRSGSYDSCQEEQRWNSGSPHNLEHGKFTSAKLPKLQLPKFNGEDPVTFLPFMDAFKENIDQIRMTGQTKMAYLVSLLQGRALESIKGMPITEASYKSAMEVLEKRFGNVNKLLEQLNDELLDLKPHGDGVIHLRTFQNRSDQLVRQLERLGQTPNNQQTLTIAERKLPNWVLTEVLKEKTVEKNSWNYYTMSNKIHEVLDLKEKIQNMTGHKGEAKISQRRVLAVGAKKPSNRGPSCQLCHGEHWSTACTKYEDLKTREDRVKELKLCFLCLGQGHSRRNCQRKVTCYKCKSNHNTALCRKKESAKEDVSTFFTQKRQNQASLMIIETVVSSPQNHKWSTTVSCLMDVGSEISFCSKKLATKLNLTPKRRSTIHLHTFASTVPKPVEAIEYELMIRLKDGSKRKLKVTAIEHMVNQLYSNEVEKNVKCDLLIGSDYFWNLTQKKDVDKNGRPVIITDLGEIPITSSTGKNEAVVASVRSEEVNLEEFFNLESLGIREDILVNDDDEALSHFKKTVRWNGERYRVKLPFKDKKRPEPNRASALRSLVGCVRRLRSNTELLAKYSAEMEKMITLGVVEEVTDMSKQECYYLPHHCIIKESKTTATRVVMNASAKEKKTNMSLNDTLYRGPVMIKNLVGVLLRTRTNKVMVSADVEKAFWTVEVDETDRDFLRFLWLRDPSKPVTSDNIIEYRFVRLPFGVISSPFILGAVIEMHLRKTNTPLALEILKNAYVDNILFYANDTKEAHKKIEESRQMFKTMGMNLRDYASSEEVGDDQKLLGYQWITKSDEIQLTVKEVKDEVLTKRGLLKLVAQVYDPMGLIQPAMLKAKILIQDLWKKEYSWDETLSPEEANRWAEVKMDFQPQTVTVPRLIKFTESCTLHVCGDASKYAIGCVSYLQSSPNLPPNLLLSKTRLAPRKGETIPRLELLAMLISVRMAKFVVEQMDLPIEKIYVWSDSKVCLWWLKSKQQQPLFVSRRLEEIKQLKAEFRYVQTEVNPADLNTRGCSVEELKANPIWWHGPPFLQLPIDQWPLTPETSVCDPSVNGEVIEPSAEREEAEPPVRITTSNSISIGEQLAKPEKFSSWKRYFNTITTLFKWKHNSKAKEKALWWCMHKAQHNNPPSNDQIRSLGLKTEHDVFLFTGRVQKEPRFFLPQNSTEAKLLILHFHELNAHSGPNQTLSMIRQQFWLPKGLQTVKRVIGRCQKCHLFKARATALPRMPELPTTRTNRSRAFQFVGLDHAGPFHINKEKKYVLLFTCFSSRAVHMEVAADLSTEETFRCCRRFVARRGVPDLMRSDNGSALKATSKLAEVAWPSTQWKFTVPHASWSNGIIERMVQLFKRALKSSVGRQRFNSKEFETLVTEVESILNSRPLMKLTDEETQIIRPIDLLVPQAKVGILLEADNPNDETYHQATLPKSCIDIYRSTMQSIDRFWNSFLTLYVDELRSRNTYVHKNQRREKITLKVNDVVMLVEDSPRNEWPLGRVTELLYGSDSKVRSAKVLVKTGRVVLRPLCELIRIPTDSDGEESSLPSTINVQPTPKNDSSEINIDDKSQKPERYNLRPRKKLLPAMIGILTILNMVNASLGIHAPKCDQIKNHQLVHVEQCHQNGFALWMDRNGYFCQEELVCKAGVVRRNRQGDDHLFPGYSPLKTLTCASKCSCPHNQTLCSGLKKMIPTLIRDFNWTQVEEPICSITPTTQCDKALQNKSIWEIDIFGTFINVNSLAVSSHIPNVTCFGQTNEGVTGDYQYCNRHPCKPWSKAFCYYPRDNLLLYHIGDQQIQISGYAHKRISYYGKLQKPEEPVPPIINCTNYGMVLTVQENTDITEVKVNGFEVSFTDLSGRQKINLPPTILNNDYHMFVQTWQNGKRATRQEIKCPAQPVCLQIKCVWCLKRLINLQCLPGTQKLILTIAMGTILVTLYILICLIKCLCKACYWPMRISSYLVKRGVKSAIRQTTESRRRIPRRNYRRLVITLVAIIFCKDVIATERTCTSKAITVVNDEECDSTNCRAYSNLKWNLKTGETACAKWTNENQTMLQTKVSVLSTHLQCYKEQLFTTYNTSSKIASIRRCRHAGSCTGSTCQEIRTDSQIFEFGKEIYKFPGRTTCEEAVGGLINGCLSPESACMFTRLYAAPEGEQFKVFRCDFKASARLEIQVFELGRMSTITKHVREGDQFTVNDQIVDIQLIENNKVMDGNMLFLESKGQKFYMLEEFFPSLKCKGLKCIYTDECLCSKYVDTKKCQCKGSEPWKTKMLPNQEIRINKEAPSINLEATVQGSIVVDKQIQILREDDYNVSVKFLELNGCFECNQEASVKLKCESKKPTLIRLQCQHDEGTSTCNNTITTVFLRFNVPKVDELCMVYSGKTRSALRVAGTLITTPDVEYSVSTMIQNQFLQTQSEPLFDKLTYIVPGLCIFIVIIKFCKFF